MTQRKLSCMVFMPFRPELTFVYELGIKPALEEISKQLPRSINPERADDILVIDDDKVAAIVATLTRSDLVIVDITEHKPSVLWELGFSHALEKPVVILSQSTRDLPFDIRNRDVLRYDLSMHGMMQLRTELSQKLLPIMQTMDMSLRYDEEIYTLARSINQVLTHLGRNSILRNLVRNEMARLEKRIRGLQIGKFDLRNERPNREIIRYFCDYVSQLDSQDCQYDTISILDFWKEITEEATNFEYLTANIHAAKAGAQIRRVFLIDARRFKDQTVVADSDFKMILEEHFYRTKPCGERIQTKVWFTENYATDVKTYKNLAIWKKASETMLFVPGYKEPGGKMSETLFTYYDEATGKADAFRDNKSEIEKRANTFREIWNRGEELAERHFRPREEG